MADDKHGLMDVSMQNAIQTSFNEVVCEIDSDGILDHEIRAIERLQSLKKKSKGITNWHSYKINKTQNDGLDVGTGFVHTYENGANIFYSKKGSRLYKMIAIGHELGHIYLGHMYPDTDLGALGNVKDSTRETAASYFSKLIVERRSGQYKSPAFISDRKYSNDEILQAIKTIQPTYDERLLNKKNNEEIIDN